MRSIPRPGRGPEIVRRHSRTFRPALLDLEPRRLLSVAGTFQPTDAEQYMLELINRARANPAAEGQRLLALAQTDPVIHMATQGTDLTAFLNAISGYGPEPPLAFNPSLIEAARDHDTAMLAANNQFHSPADYLTNPGTAVNADGQAYYPTGQGAWATGENIFAYSSNVADRSLQGVVDYFDEAFLLDWGNPDFGHLKNLLAPGPAEAGTGPVYPFSEIGIGLLTGVTPTVAPNANNPIAANQGVNVGPDLVTQEFGWRSGNAFLTGAFYRDDAGSGFYAPGEGLGAVSIAAVGRAGQGTFTTQTWASGGYALALPPGTYDVTAAGNRFPTRTTVVTIGQNNVSWEVGIVPGPAPAIAADRPVPGDYNGTGTADLAVYRTSTAQWFIAGQAQPVSFGAANVDIPVPGDYDGTGHTEIAVYRPTTAQWFIAGHGQPVQFGWAGVDIPVPGNYDGTGHTEVAVYRPTTAQWFIAGHSQPVQFGWAGVDIPVPGNYDGTGHTEVAVYRPTTAQWFIAGHEPIAYGWAGVDVPMPGDYDGTGHTEVAVFRPTTAQWFIAGHDQPIAFGAGGLDVPVPGRYNGDGKVDVAVFRPTTAEWFIGGESQGRQFGQAGTSVPVSGWLGGSALQPGSPITRVNVSDASTHAGMGRSALDLGRGAGRRRHVGHPPGKGAHRPIGHG